jgi:hypothetical protein
MGGRNIPLEADFSVDVAYDHEMVGDVVEVSSIADGTLEPLRDKEAEILGVITRFGQIVGYKVKVKGDEEKHGPAKDFFVDRCLVEDIQPPTATSAALREGLSHWGQQRDYWHTDTGGLESLVFAVASVTPRAVATAHEWGWEFMVPDPMPLDSTQVRCLAFQHGKFWTMATTVTPHRAGDAPRAGGHLPRNAYIEDHWARVFDWTYKIARGMAQYGWPWEQEAHRIKARAIATSQVLVPMATEALRECLAARREITGTAPDLLPGSVSVGFSVVRLKPNTVGLTEPPTDRRPYTVMSIAPSAAKDLNYLRQVLLHECIHIAVANPGGGPPHNGLFNAMAEKVGLEPKHRD